MVYWYYNKKTFNLDSRRLPNLPELYCKSSPWALISGDEANIQNDAEWNLKIASSSLAVGILKPVMEVMDESNLWIDACKSKSLHVSALMLRKY